VLEANIAIAPSNPQVIYAMVGVRGIPRADRDRWASISRAMAVRTGRCARGSLDLPRRSAIQRPRRATRGHWAASAAATCRPSSSTQKNENVIYSASIVMWRTEDGGKQLVGGPGIAGRRRLSAHLDPS